MDWTSARRQGLWLVLLLLGWVSPSRGQPSLRDASPTVESFLSWCEAHRVRRGAVHATYAISSAGDGEVFVQQLVFGWDAESGAWMTAGPTAGGGRTALGRGYRITATGEVQQIVPPDDLPLLVVAEVFPRAMLSYFVERPEVLVQAEVLDGGGWRIAYKQWSNHQGPLGYAEFAEGGTAVRRWQDEATDRRETEFQYDDDALRQGVEVVASLSRRRDLMLIDLALEGSGVADRFAPEAVESRIRDLAMSVEAERAAMRQGYSRNADGKLVVDPDMLRQAPYGGGKLRKWRLPLLGAGCVMLLVAGAEVWRRRAS